MTAFNNLKISVKILALVLVLSALTLGIAFAGSSTLNKVDGQYAQLVTVKLPTSTQLARANRRAIEVVYAAYQAVNHDSGSQAAKDAIEAEQRVFGQANEMFDSVAEMQPKLKPEMDGLRDRVAKMHDLAKRAITLAQAGRRDDAFELLSQADKAGIELSKVMAAANDERVKEAKELSSSLSAQVSSTSTTLLIVSLIAIVGVVLLSMFISRKSITGPIARLESAMGTLAGGQTQIEVEGTDRRDEIGAMAKAVLVFRDAAVEQKAAEAQKAIADAEQKVVVQSLERNLGKLAEGDLTTEISESFGASYITVKTNFNEAVTALRTLIGSVMESTSTIRTGAGEIAQASEDLARRTESNAASLEETSAAVTQMDDRLKATASAAGRTVERADGAIATVSGGRAIADEAVQAMTRVSESAKGIDSVIEGLDKIAFQTRVLAMNAAVEAGRAGEAGRGFAVVADLVSALAMRAEEEAGRARDQLTATQTDIVTAVEMVQKVDGALANISGDVGEVHKLLADMATDNQAQSSAITQISSAIGSMDQATQQNAAMVEETSAAARNLSSEVSQLADQASRFSVGNAAPQVRAIRTPAIAHAPSAAPVKAIPVAAMANGAGSDGDWATF